MATGFLRCVEVRLAHDSDVDGPADDLERELHPSTFRTPPAALTFISAGMVFLAFIVVMIVVHPLNLSFGLWFSQAFVFIGVPFVLTRLSGRDPVRYPGLWFPGFGPTLFGFAIGAANFFALAIPLQFASQELFTLLLGEDFVNAFDSARIFENRTAIELALILGGVTIAAPLGEEYFFRGVLQRSLAEGRRTVWRAIVVAAFIFSAFHMDPVGLLARFELGVVFGWLYLRTGSIWPSVMAHAANNTITTVIFFVGGGADAQAAADIPLGEQLRELAIYSGVSLIALGGLLFVSRKRADLLSPLSPPERVLPPVTFRRAAAPWIAAAAASLVLLFAVDHRGVRMNVLDLMHPLPPATEKAHGEQLRELRQKARSGEVPVPHYASRRRELSKGEPAPALPPPKMPAPELPPAPVPP